jgi:hypothetical protein
MLTPPTGPAQPVVVRVTFVAGLAFAAVLPVAAARRVSAAGPDQPSRRSHLEPVGELSVPQSAGDLGLRLSRASAVLRQQLALDRGAGLVVDEVAADSVAQRAGFRQHDVLVKLDDQLLVLPEQFNALLEATAGGSCGCHVLRGGRMVELPLGAPAEPVAAAQPAPRPAAPRAVGSTLRPTASTLSILPQPPVARQVEPVPVMRKPAGETLLRQDADYQIRLAAGDEMRLVVSDAKGRVVFNDAIDTPEGRSRMPLAVRGRVEQMEKLLERPAPTKPVAEIGRLDTAPIEIR